MVILRIDKNCWRVEPKDGAPHFFPSKWQAQAWVEGKGLCCSKCRHPLKCKD